jgi:hypothetical protein
MIGKGRPSERDRLVRNSHRASSFEVQQRQVADVLTELFDLFEQYAPAWYTRKHHYRVESALRILRKS